MINQIFHKLTVIKTIKKNNGLTCICRCECGNEISLPKNALTSGNNKSCGCLVKKNIVGQKINFLTIISHFTKNRTTKNLVSKISWSHCICDCGNKKDVQTSKILNGHTKSCGCFKPFKKDTGKAAEFALYNKYKRGAEDRKLDFLLSEEEAHNLFIDNCFYCNAVPANKTKSKRMNGFFVYNGIDRVDNNLGYTTKNTVSCCKKCNFMKMKLDINDFVRQCKLITKHMENK